tara:strand:- start:874 stop:1248 length:375 start_codon:yes stop_codon:yes gene_type:complete
MRKIFLLLATSSALYAEVIETFYQTGELKERYNLKDGVRDGIYTKWYLNGQIGRQANYKIGIMNGELKTWYPNGIVKATYPIVSGKIEGTAKYYDSDGNLSWQVYSGNRPDSENSFDLSNWCLN